MKKDQPRNRNRRQGWNPALDSILKAGAAGGPSRLRKAIQRIREREPKMAIGRILKRTAELGLTSWKTPWSTEQKAFVLDHAREFSAAEIARRLGRTPHAVEHLLSCSRQSAKLQEGFTQSDLAQALRVSPRKVRRWVRVGWLNVHEGRVKERSLQGFLRGHSDEIDSEKLEPDLRAWLQGLGLKEGARHSRQWSGQRQHAVRVFLCGGCGRKVCGNAFYRHLRACRKVTHASN